MKTWTEKFQLMLNQSQHKISMSLSNNFKQFTKIPK